MSEDKSKIRLHRYERILAVKWPGDEHWLMIWPDPYPDLAPPGQPAAQTEWNRLARDDDMDGHGWIDPVADHHRDLTRLTAATVVTPCGEGEADFFHYQRRQE